MTDKISPERRSRNMAAIRSKDTSPEVIVRKLLHSIGYRYKLHGPKLPGKPDIVFKTRKKVVFVHGCFWHGCERPGCLDSRRPKSNTGYWTPKLRRNKERDAENAAALKSDGWDVLIIWACETKDQRQLKAKLSRFLGPCKLSKVCPQTGHRSSLRSFDKDSTLPGGRL